MRTRPRRADRDYAQDLRSRVSLLKQARPCRDPFGEDAFLQGSRDSLQRPLDHADFSHLSHLLAFLDFPSDMQLRSLRHPRPLSLTVPACYQPYHQPCRAADQKQAERARDEVTGHRCPETRFGLARDGIIRQDAGPQAGEIPIPSGTNPTSRWMSSGLHSPQAVPVASSPSGAKISSRMMPMISGFSLKLPRAAATVRE